MFTALCSPKYVTWILENHSQFSCQVPIRWRGQTTAYNLDALVSSHVWTHSGTVIRAIRLAGPATLVDVSTPGIEGVDTADALVTLGRVCTVEFRGFVSVENANSGLGGGTAIVLLSVDLVIGADAGRLETNWAITFPVQGRARVVALGLVNARHGAATRARIFWGIWADSRCSRGTGSTGLVPDASASVVKEAFLGSTAVAGDRDRFGRGSSADIVGSGSTGSARLVPEARASVVVEAERRSAVTQRMISIHRGEEKGKNSKTSKHDEGGYGWGSALDTR